MKFLKKLNDIRNKENTPKFQKISKKNLIIILAIFALAIIAYGINNIINTRYETLLRNHQQAINDIENQNVSGYKNAFEILSKLDDDHEASRNDLYYLGYIYQYGIGTAIDYSKAYKYYKASSGSNNSLAEYQIAILYINGYGVNKDYVKAKDYLLSSYEHGNSKALIELAIVYEKDPSIFKDNDKILFKLYDLNKSGKIKLDEASKINLINECIEKNYEPALIDQAQEYTNTGDVQKAMIIWQNLLNSQNKNTVELANSNINRIANSKEKSKTLDNNSSNSINADAKPSSVNNSNKNVTIHPIVKDIIKYDTNDIVLEAINSTKPISTLSPKLVKNLTSNQGIVETSTSVDSIITQAKKTVANNKNISSIYSKQEEYEENIRQLGHDSAYKDDYRKLYELEMQANKGSTVAIYELGEYYFAQDDFDTAIQLYLDAADKGYAPANYKIANLYYSEDDNGLPFDTLKAKEYYKKAAAGGIKNAQMILQLMD